jgi:LacI family repressor for deo operon, udp, cdd, tsx, nupC, and nupG
LVTIRDIARQAGVSVATVSRTLSEPDAVRAETRARVQEAVSAMNYTPNAIARQLRRQRKETIIVIVPDISNPFFSGIVKGIENLAHDMGYRVLLGETQGKQERLDYYADLVLTRIADGLILLGSLLPTMVQASVAAGQAPSIPLVLACERFDGLQCPTVGIDNVAAARMAVMHLVQRGCSKIATITGPADNSLSLDRAQGYREVLAAAGLPVDAAMMGEGDFTIESGFAAMNLLLDKGLVVDGVFCANDEMAIGAQQAVLSRGLRVPQDVAVMGFDDIRFGAFAYPPLSTIRQPVGDLGEAAMRALDEVLHKKPTEQQSVILPHELVVRGSTAAG